MDQPQTEDSEIDSDTSAPITLEDIKIEEKEDDQEQKSNIKSDEDAGEEKVNSVFMDNLPWLIAAGIGFSFLIIAAGLLASAHFLPFVSPYKPQYFNIPHYQGSMRVYSVDGQKLKYVNDLRFIGSQVSRSLRYKVEPKLKQIYSNASLDVDSVVVLSFKYGGAGEGSVTQDRRSIIGRSADSEKESAIVVRHWVYLAQNTTDTVESLKAKIIIIIDKADGIKIDRSSVSLKSLENMKRVDAIKALAQAGFFKNGLAGLDLGLLNVFGLSSIPELYSEDDEGLCRSLRVPRHGSVSPSICTTSINTFVKMACEFSCDAEYEVVGSHKRVCLSSGLWSGETAQCHKTCSPLKMVSVGKILPLTCRSHNISAGQMCFLECPSTMYRMIFPPDLSFLRKLPERDMWPSQVYKTEKSAEAEPYSDVKGYFRECGTEGRWIGSDASCKALCPNLHPPPHGSVQPFNCQDHPVEGQRCTVSCDYGYGIMGGTQILTCDVTGKWTNEIPVCQKLCPYFSQNQNMTVSPRICLTFPHEGIECEHGCRAGYALSGARTRTCAGGSWDNTLPSCVQTCRPLANPKNGMFVHDGGQCNVGYIPEGADCRLVCDAGRLPSHLSTRCSAGAFNYVGISKCYRPCTPLDSGEFGLWSPSSCNVTHYAELGPCNLTSNLTCNVTHYAELGPCNLTCNVGYTLYGSSSVTCSDDGDWSDQPGKCIMNCPALNSTYEGPAYCFDGTATVGQICQFACNAGSRIIGDRTLTCMDNGTWSASLQRCQDEVQYYIFQTSKSHTICLIVDADGNANKLDNRSGSCDTENGRWILDGNHLQNVFTRTCLTANQSSTLMHMQECFSGNPDQKFESGFGLTLKIYDKEKYITSGYRTIENLQLASFVSSFSDESLLWTFHDTTFGLSSVGSSLFSLRYAGNCKTLHGFISSDMHVLPSSCNKTLQAPNSACTVYCLGGDLNYPGESLMSCVDGRWKGNMDIYCIPRSSEECRPFSHQPEWNILIEPSDCTTTNTKPGGHCTIKCGSSTEEYLDGPSVIECLESGRWSPRRTPVCKRRCKSLLPVPKNSYLITANALHCSGVNGLPKPGSICVLTCGSGFKLTGASVLTCMENGEWSSPLPECTAVCNDLQNIPHGYLTNCSSPKLSSGYLAGSTCDIACERGFHPGLSVPSITCQSDGAWIIHVHGNIECLRSCLVLAITSPMKVSPDCLMGTLTVGHKCTFYCGDGYGLSFANPTDDDGSVMYTRTCMDDRTWSGSVAACTKRCGPLPEIGETDGGFYNPSTCQTSSFKLGTICSLLCQGDDAVYGGPSVLTCGENGHWKPNVTFGKCSPACGALPKSPYITITPESCTKRFVKKGTDCILTCPGHMERIGPGYRKCVGVPDFVSGSLWSGSARSTTCLGRCLALTINIGSLVFPNDCTHRSKLEGDICSFECSAGYSVLGNAVLRCTSSGAWDNAAPSCYKPCPPITVSNGQVSCNEAYGFFSEGLGYVYRPGAKCYYSCSSGFAAYTQNDISCDEDGVWKSAPYCSPVSDAFPIIQKIADESVCLQVSRLGSDESSEGSEWHLTTTTNSIQGCQTAGNNAMWIWFYSLNLKHAETGLCLTAESALADASILLHRCDISNKLQHWTCDAQHPYRFVLKDTDLSIDTVYKALGPVLQSWTHAETYWITFNSVLEAAGTVCSNKLVGACPGINKQPSMKVVPAVCSTDEVTIWQKCALSCEEGALFDGSTDVVECQPTGEWKDLDHLFCRKNCPALPAVENGYYDVPSCIEGESIHQTICNLTCSASYVLPNNREFSPFACNDGKWIGEFGLTCQDRCKNPPVAPNNGRIDCLSKTCQIVCNMGYTIRGGSSLFNCTDGYDYVTANNISCYEEYHFRLQLRTAVFTPFPTICISAIIERGLQRVGKVPCYAGNSFHYWRWEDSHDVMGRNFSMLRNAGTGLCLSASSVENWAELVLKNCNETDNLQQWTCHNYLHPGRFGLVSSTRFYVDAGSILPFAPPVLREENVGTGSSDWIAVDLYGNLKYTCGSRKIGGCPKLFLGSYTAVDPQGCASWDGLPVDAECRTSCQHDDYQLPGGVVEHITICLDSGTWHKHPQLCTAKSSDNGTCASLTLTRWLIVTPEKCGEITGQNILVGESCEFTCKSGYYLEGPEQILCIGRDHWTDRVPKCIRYCLGIPPKQGVELSSERCRSLVVPDGTTCNMTCAEGFLSGTALPSFVVTECQIDGTWTVSEMLCEATCQALSEPPFNATSDADDLQDPILFRRFLTSSSCANSSSLPRTICAFSCGSGSVTVGGSDELTCDLNGMWNARTQRCVKKYYCPKPINTNLAASYAALLDDIAVYPGTVLKIKCDDGYIPNGDDVRMCQIGGMWGGNGQFIPACTKKCMPLVPPFAAEISPTRCFAGYVEDGVNCTFLCADGTEIEADVTATLSVTQCNKGEWSNPIPKCLVKDPSNVDSLNVLTYPDGFLIITRKPESGCLYAAEDKVVRWRPAQECDPSQLENRWKWYDSQQIMNARGDQCMQPLDSTQSNSTLIVGDCNSSVTFVCGNPRSVFYKYSLFTSSSPRWRIIFITHHVKGTPESIFMVKAELGLTDLPNDVFEGITVYGNVDIMNPSNTDSTVCSYACRASISFANDYHTNVITSPGFIFNQKYPPNTYCEWDFFGFGKIITLELREIDMEPNENRDCLTDCLNVHDSDSEGSMFSEHLATYSGNDIFAQRLRVIMSVSSSLHVTFWTDSANQAGGFAMSYKFEDVPDTRTQCGVRGKYDKELADSVTTGKNPGLRGDFADIKKWPWLVSIREKYRGSSKAYHRCTGALIDNNVVVTAAHCARFTRDSSLSSVDMGVGLTLQNDMDEAARKKTTATSEPMFQIYHGYDYISRNGDIALWKLSEPIILSDSISPICLPLDGYRIHQPKATCFSAGWNSLTRGYVLNQIMEYEVTMASSSWCRQTLGLNSKTTFACAENVNFDTSGLHEKTESEPLMCEFNGNWYLAGVRSYTHIGTRRVFRLYTEVSRLTNWIAHAMETMNMYSTPQGGHLLI